MQSTVKCKVIGCSNPQRTKHVVCPSCWNKLPIALKESVRNGTTKGEHSLRARPANHWMENASKYVGKIKYTFVPSSNNNNKKKEKEK